MKNLLTMSVLCVAFGLTAFGLTGCGSAPGPTITEQAPQHAAHGADNAKQEADKYKGGRPSGHSAK